MAHVLKQEDRGDGTHLVTVAVSAVDTAQFVIHSDQMDSAHLSQILDHLQARHVGLSNVREAKPWSSTTG